MAKKKKSIPAAQADLTNGTSTAPQPARKPEPSKPQPSLIISRNKHWRYISSFHGPWLQLTVEALESLAHTNYFSPRPHPIDPAVFYDVLKIRKAVDEAASLAVRANAGIASSALNNNNNNNNGLYGGAGQLLGFGMSGGGEAKLSKERKFRMREQATLKLSQAYQLDEVATSVATMQSASSLDDVASHVLQRKSSDPDAKYVHFFHEKIPARMMAECTSLQPLDEVIASKPMHGSSYRTRALTRLFKNDWDGAARDLTAGLHECRALQAQHMIERDQLVLASEAVNGNGLHTGHDRGKFNYHATLEESEQPVGLEAQLLFHRATVYFEIASQHIDAALDGLQEWQAMKSNPIEQAYRENGGLDLTATPEARMAHRRRLEARKVVKTNARRALKDLMQFLDKLDYTPRLSQEVTEEFFRRVNVAANGTKSHKGHSMQRYLEGHESNTSGPSDALILSSKKGTQQASTGWSSLPPLNIHKASDLFQPIPVSNLPPFPVLPSPSSNPIAEAVAESSESITYHPLLTDALHILLLCHALLQTSSKELLRHAHNVARLARICDGYPIFLAPRSPARADWVEVLRRTDNWIGLQSSWEKLCSPAPLPNLSSASPPPPPTNGSLTATSLTTTTTAASTSTPQPQPETEEKRRERITQRAIVGALGDARVVDEETFDRAVKARIKRAEEDDAAEMSDLSASSPSPAALQDPEQPQQNGNAARSTRRKANGNEPKRWAQEDGKEYPISTERADAIARWVKEAPLHVEGGAKKKTGVKRAGRRVLEVDEDGDGPDGRMTPASSTAGLEESVELLVIEECMAR